ncbi:MAG: hypothetical protein U0353_18330 [Sandaracinus sp.]
MAEYAVGMERGRIEVRHAAWDAAAGCRAHWPAELGRTVDLSITLDRRGRVVALDASPDASAFERCLLRALRRHSLRPTGEDRRARRWTVVTRYVFTEPA